MIDGENFFDQPVKNNLRTYYNRQKIAIGQGEDYTIDCLLDYHYFINNFFGIQFHNEYKHYQKSTDMFNKQDVAVFLTYIKILKD